MRYYLSDFHMSCRFRNDKRYCNTIYFIYSQKEVDLNHKYGRSVGLIIVMGCNDSKTILTVHSTNFDGLHIDIHITIHFSFCFTSCLGGKDEFLPLFLGT